MDSSCGEGKVATLFTAGVSSSVEGEMVIDEAASTVNLTPHVCIVPGATVAVRESEECVQEFVYHLSGEESTANRFVPEGEADRNDSFVDESERWTFADAPARANLSVETLAEGVVGTSRLTTCESSFFLHCPLAFGLEE